MTAPFAGRRTRVLSLQDVRRLLDVPTAIGIQRRAFMDLAAGRSVVARNAWLRLPEDLRRGWLKLLAGYDAPTKGLGVKVLARFPERPSGANLGSLVLLFDDESGFPLAVMDGVYITAVRTGAGAALACEALGAPEAPAVGVVGTGVVARFSLRAMAVVRPRLGPVRVYSRSEDRRRGFAEWCADELGTEARPAASVEEAVEGAEVVVTGTNAREPIFDERHLERGRLILAMGIRTEVAPEAVARCLVVPDGRQEALHEGKFSVALEAGLVTEGDLGPELGALLAEEVSATLGERPVLFDSSGVAVQDVAAARAVWERAEREEVGTEVDLGLGHAF